MRAANEEQGFVFEATGQTKATNKSTCEQRKPPFLEQETGRFVVKSGMGKTPYSEHAPVVTKWFANREN